MASQVYSRGRVEKWHVWNVLARLGSGWHATVLDEENIVVLKQVY